MNSLLPHLLGKEHFRFIEVHSYSSLSTHIHSYFKENITSLYGDQKKALDKIFKNKDRTCKLLCKGQERIGIIVYKDDLTDEFFDLGKDKVFEIKTLAVINPKKNAGKRIGACLLKKVIEIAIRRNAKSVFVTVSSARPEALAFFTHYGFLIRKINRNLYVDGLDEYFLFHAFPQQLLKLLISELLVQKKQATLLNFSINRRVLDFSCEEALILSLLFQGYSKQFILKEVALPIHQETPTDIFENVQDKLVKYCLNWGTSFFEKEYLILFISSLYKSKEIDGVVGCLLVGITQQGRQDLLGIFPFQNQPISLWIHVFQKLKEKGVKDILIVSKQEETQLPLTVESIYPGVRVVESEFIKKWFIEDFGDEYVQKFLQGSLDSIMNRIKIDKCLV